ncbi:tyrosine-protein phosphatase [Paenibacillus sp. 1P07SE]|uniref:tyrosine-protein phosphatase n=1 Tax=Paenibacillus sp. 1P07SE TaxID=3132209 RepID=UPI0039A49DB6
MIDIHTHILPGIDDGAADWEAALAMARAAAAEGITTIIATPHHASGSWRNPADGVRQLTGELQERLDGEGIAVQVRPGQEIRVHGELFEAWDRGELLTLGDTSYILIELPFTDIPAGMPELIHELRVLGLRPIIAHPERNAPIMKQPQRLSELIEAGAWGQVTAASLLGGFGKRCQESAWTLSRSGLIHIVSSDAHHIERRGFRMREAYDEIERQLGTPWKDYFLSNAEAVAADGPFAEAPSIPSSNNNIWDKITRIFRK